MKLIDKDALVAEIESKIEKYTKRGEESDAKRDGHGMYWGGVLSCLNEVRTLCDTLEVKEAVDAEIVEVEDNNNSIYAYTHLEICTNEDLSKICKAGDKAKVIIIKQKNSYESIAM